MLQVPQLHDMSSMRYRVNGTIHWHTQRADLFFEHTIYLGFALTFNGVVYANATYIEIGVDALLMPALFNTK